jgi:hypothetical protein
MATIFTPVVDADAVYGEGDWRPIVGEGPRKDNWRVLLIGKQSAEHKLRGVILPSFDFTMDLEDRSFMQSIGPCWTDQPQKGMERHFAANAWAIPLMMYPYLGPNKEHWISPGNRRNMIGNDVVSADDTMDAFDDLNKSIRKNKQLSQARKDFFLKAESMKEDAPIPTRTVRYFAMNEATDKENDWGPVLTGFTASAYSYLIEQMRWRHEDAGEARDPNWPKYMLGDPTNPAAALEWHVDKVLLDAKDTHETNVLCFTERREFLDNDQKTRPISEAMLARRFLMVDPASWNIPTYEEQVEYMMESFDPAVTADMIRAACSHRCRFDIPKQRPESVTLQEGVAASDNRRTERASSREELADAVASVSGGSGLAPRSSAPPMPRDEPAEPTYLAGTAGSPPQRLTVAQLQKVMSSGAIAGYKVKVNDEWKTIETCGLVHLPEVDDSVPADTVPDTVPVDAPKSQPAAEQPKPASADAGGITLEAMSSKLFPDAAVLEAFTPEQRAQATDLVQRAWEATEHGTKRDLPADVVEDLIKLLG